ncbi:MAG: hypothetical protein A2445_03975 [Candidatus Jacksonbacteria bacterium RIFOXYC2_FULL_44_29]|nr:MAG: hypothetical protein UV19_C0001G0059 [Parcubacteria group bacterium GW2011_GWA2_42_28]KKT56254.1 MAG: hypothetical protein UW45_C0001G0058 [Parcubacteria group bacterium GW2011_GWC2_44_22]OGY76098.1 MAG: hypothetical protein A2240_00195 [Candidatus Jacksonbacteria bacterium RIFOXYA2_FULL_43_12]OGY77689.1 MAG: hypothetical protein A2295_02695 [Candidatus Jacksonbacteria bacterium RIFOXYB2_FULL_44_15]OGY78825.1 MAG: hypothetical protein A2550_04760 [Candidatus Jacksonbacteria bacterium RI
MRPDYEQLFTHLTPPEPPAGLLGKVMNRIYQAKRLQNIKRRVFVFSMITLGSVLAFISSAKMLHSGLTQSGFTQFFSLLFSDFQIVITNWQNYSLSLLETLPIMSLILFVGITLIFLEALKFLIRDLKLILPRTNI